MFVILWCMVSIRHTIDIPPSRKVRFDMDLPQSVRCGISSVILSFPSIESETGAGAKDGWRRLYGLDKKYGDTLNAFLDRKHSDKALEDEIDARQLSESLFYRTNTKDSPLKNK